MEPILRIRQDVRQGASQVVAVKDPDMALLFCHVAASGSGCALPPPEQLGMSRERLEKARQLLVLYGVCSDSQGPEKPRQEIEYAPQELKEARQTDGAFAGLCQYYEGALGRMLKQSELELLYGVYATLGMEAQVLMLLINYCAGQKRLAPRTLEREAYRWHKDGVETYAQAEQYLANLQQRHSRQGEIMRMFGIYDRKLSEGEQRMVEKWVAYGYDDDLIALAYDRTVLRTGGLKWAYLDSILESWRVAGYKTRKEVESLEGQGQQSPRANGQQAPRPRGEFESGVVAAVTKQFERRRMERNQLQEQRLAQMRQRSPSFAENERALRLCASRAARAAVGGESGQLAQLQRENQQLLAQRAQLMQGLGVTEEQLNPPPQCPQCQDQGYIGTEMCQCFRQACQQEEQRRRN